MIARTLLLLSLIAIPAVAGEWDRKSPPPLPKKIRSCLKVFNKPRCIPIEREVLNAYGLKSGQSVTAKTLFQIYDENERYLKTKLR